MHWWQRVLTTGVRCTHKYARTLGSLGKTRERLHIRFQLRDPELVQILPRCTDRERDGRKLPCPSPPEDCDGCVTEVPAGGLGVDQWFHRWLRLCEISRIHTS